MSADKIEQIKNLFPDLDDDLIASFLESNGNNVERTIDFMLNNQGGFDIQEEPVYQRQEPQKKKEVELSAEALFTKAKNSYKSRQFLDAKNSATKVLESDVLTGKLTVWGFRAILILIKSIVQMRENNYFDYLQLLFTEYNLHLREFGSQLVSVFHFLNQNGTNVKQAFDLIVNKSEDPVINQVFLRQIAFNFLPPDIKVTESYPKFAGNVDQSIVKDVVTFNSTSEIEQMVKGNNLPSLFLIGSDRFSASAGKNLKFKTLVSLTNAIKFSHNLREISISSSKIDLNAAKLIADAISNHFSLQSFSITETTIGTDGASTIFSALQNLPLTNLSLDYNKIGSKTTFSLLPMNTLVELDLSNNSIGNEGGAKVAKLIEESHTLKKLSLSGDLALGEAGVNSIGEALQNNNSLEHINLSCCINKFLELVANNHTLKSVDFSNILDPSSKKMVTPSSTIKVSL